MLSKKLQSKFGPIRQVAYVVKDIDQAVESWHRQMGVGPFAVVRNVSPLAGSTYRGEESGDIVLNLAFAYIGDIQLELIEQVNDTPSMYQEALAKGAHSLHHYAVTVDDYDACFNHAMANGFEPIVEAGHPDFCRMSYVESTEIPGLILEIIEWNDFTCPYFDGIGRFLAEADASILKHDYQL